MASVSLAQPPQNKKALSLLKSGKEYVRVEEYETALPYLLSYDSTVRNDPEANFYLGIVYFHLDEWERALVAFDIAQKAKEPFKEFFLYKAKVFHLLTNDESKHLIDSAEKYYKKHLQITTEEKDKKWTQAYISQCAVARKLMKTPVPIKVENLGDKINTEYPDFGPVISADQQKLIFTSKRPVKDGGTSDVKDERGRYFEDLYETTKNKDGEWRTPRNMGPVVNTETHDASIGLAADGSELYIYKTEGKEYYGDIFVSYLRDTSWTKPDRLPDGINSPQWEPSASINRDRKILYFTSNRKEPAVYTSKFGDNRDIYIVRRLPDGKWAKAQNIGQPINTDFDEDAPFIHSDGITLYFSSNGPNSMGGFDIFKSKYDPKTDKWSEPVNMGYPINSTGDDIYFVWSADGVNAYFASRRNEGFGEVDIYMLSMPESDSRVITLDGKVIDKESRKALASTVEITIKKDKKPFQLSNTNIFTGKFQAFLNPDDGDYVVKVTAPGYVPITKIFHMPEEVDVATTIPVEYELQKIEDYKGGEISSLNFDQPKLSEDAQNDLENIVEMLNKNPDINVEIVVHQKKAPDVDSLISTFETKTKADQLVEKTIELGAPSNRVQGVGLGTTYADKKKFGENKFLVEYIIIHREEDVEALYGKFIGEDKKALKDEKVKYDSIYIAPEDIKPGYVLNLKFMINFTTGSSNIDPTPDNEDAINEMLYYMKKYPQIKIEISGHTDNVGGAEYNQKLSERRAQTVRQQLIFKGIPADRITSKGYGLTKPIASNNTPEGRRTNRRIQAEITAVIN
jgi:outer membrane protein OmpA-like peptidoglycan-associated protein/tetratricopeptide (TPR) repeat protein